MRAFTLILILTLTLSFLTTAESGYPIPKVYKYALLTKPGWDAIGPFMDKLIPQWTQAAEAFTEIREMYRAVLHALSGVHVDDLRILRVKGVVDAFKHLDFEKLLNAIRINISKINPSSMFTGVRKVFNALVYGVTVEGRTVPVTLEMVVSEVVSVASVEGAEAVEVAVIGIEVEEAASIIAAVCLALFV